MRRSLITFALAFAVIAQPPVASLVRAASEYFLPAPAGTSLLVYQGNSSAFDHVAANGSQYAWDFTEGTTEFPVVASRGGTVIGARSDSTNTACRDLSCWKDANYVLVDHGDGTSALYLHLATGSVTVTQGQKVEQGAPLGRADSTGFSYGTHLHFMVEKTPTARTAAGWWWTQSLPISFADAGSAVEGKSYVSANQLAGIATPTPAPTPTPRPTPVPTPKPTPTPPAKPKNPTGVSFIALVSGEIRAFSCPLAPGSDGCWDMGLQWRYSGPPIEGFHIWVQSMLNEGFVATCDPNAPPRLVMTMKANARLWHDVHPFGQLRGCLSISAFNSAGESRRIDAPLPGY
jgi:Peptidase family M23